MKFALLIIALLAQSSYAQLGMEKKIAAKPKEQQYQTDYDKFKDQTQITSPRFTVNRLEDKKTFPGAGVTLYLTYPGKEVSDKARFYLAIVVMGSRDWQWTGLDGVIILADGKRFDLKVDDRDTDVRSSGGLGRYVRPSVSVTEEIYSEVSAADLRTILAASKVEVQAGRVEFALHDASITVFKNILSLTN